MWKTSFFNTKKFFLSKKNTIILIDDEIKLKYFKNDKEIKTKIVVGGNPDSNKGINLPNLILNTKPLTHKDKNDQSLYLITK